jgi:hypothetical protein
MLKMKGMHKWREKEKMYVFILNTINTPIDEKSSWLL